MKTITQITRFRQSFILYSQKHGVSQASRKYNISRNTVYRWLKRYDGNLDSLIDYSKRPHSHPNQHTCNEIKLISDMRKRNPNAGLIVFWVKLKLRGYSRSVTALFRIIRKLNILPVKPPNPKYIPKPYEQMTYPGQRLQIDVKHVPSVCIVGDSKGKKFYQFTAIDEYSRYRYLEAFEDNSSFSASIFLEHCIKRFPFPIECVQTDNGREFTNRFTSHKDKSSMFEVTLKTNNIRHKLIKPYTPRHNGKVERSHRKDNEYFYAVKTFYSFNDLVKQLKIHNIKYNNFPMRPLGWKSPKDFMNDYLKVKE